MSGFARLSEPPSAAVKHNALVSRQAPRDVHELACDRRIDRVSGGTDEPAERVARADQLLESATKYLPLLEQYENERAEEPDSEPSDQESREAVSRQLTVSCSATTRPFQCVVLDA
jgi:hypothetical protein